MPREKIADAIIVGSGAGGATAANELTKAGKKVAVIERGPRVVKVTGNSLTVRRGGRDVRAWTVTQRMHVLYDKAVFQYTDGKIALGTSALVGGPTWVSGGNGIRCGEEKFKKFGIDLSEQWEEAESDMRVEYAPERLWGPVSLAVRDAAKRLGYDVTMMPKTIDMKRCTGCGNCFTGCPTGAKWSAGEYIDAVEQRGSLLIPETLVTDIITENGRAIGVRGIDATGSEVEYYADAIIVSAGGIRTPVLLRKAGIAEAGKGLFTDVCLVTFGFTKETRKTKELTVPYVFPDFLDSKGFISMPMYYFASGVFAVDYDASKGKYYPYLNWRTGLEIHIKRRLRRRKYARVMAMMSKIKDEPIGEVLEDGSVRKKITGKDQEKLDACSEWCGQVLAEAGCDRRTISRGMLTAGHLGGTAAMGKVVDENFETYAIKNLFVCDLSVVGGEALGMPPLLLIVAFSKHFGKKLAKDMS